MGLIGRVLSFSRVTDENGSKLDEVEFDPGGGPNLTGNHFSSPGDDSQPLPDDYLATVPGPRSGGRDAVGYMDVKNEGVAGPGEKRIYARSVGGTIVAEVYLKSDGSVIIKNDLGGVMLFSTGDILANNVLIDVLGNITTAGIITAGQIVSVASITAASLEAPSIKVAGKELAGHTHPYLGLVVGVPGTTGPNN